LIDLHFHCLPGIDDGPSSWDDAVALCRAAAAEGVETIVATPHVLRSPWLNESPAERDELLLKLNSRLGGTPAILPGCEFFFASDALELWERGSTGPLTGLNRTGFLLMEIGGEIPREIDSCFHEFSLLGVTPIVAHPERSPAFASAPERLGRLIALGAKVQITAAALVGDFGPRAEAACRELLDKGVVHLVASDAHSLESRPPRLSAARERVRRNWGEEVEQGIFEANPKAVIEGRALPWGT